MKTPRLISGVLLAALLLAGCRRDRIDPTPLPPTPEVPEDPDPGEEPEPKVYGTIPCILIEFQDVRFEDKDVATYFDDVLNGEKGVRQYYMDNSLGTFVQDFDIYGPVTLEKYRAYYGSDVIVEGVRADVRADQALAEACRQLDADVDFSHYDLDGDGVIDNVLYIYAGHDQSQGGPFEAIWAHQWFLSRSTNPSLRNLKFDDVRLDSYFCGPQFRGAEGRKPSGPGIFAHEFGHALGLPDFYGKSERDLSNFSIMCHGLFNEDGFTPPYFNAEERIMLGWMERENLLVLQPGWQVLSAVRNNAAYLIPTQMEGEYFIVEYRDSRDWDAPEQEGLVVYHADRSAPYLERWEKWREPGMGINDLPDHPCFYISNTVFPSIPGPTAVEPVSWDGTPVSCQLTNICITEQGLGLYAQYDCGPNVNGYVRNSYGDPVEGALVMLEDVQAVSDSDGHYMVEEPLQGSGEYTLKVSAQGYRDFQTTVSMGGARVLSVPVTLKREKEGEDFTLSKYDISLDRGYYSKSGIGAVKFTAQDLQPYVGGVLKEVVFYPLIRNSFGGDVYVTVDIGKERVLTKKLEHLSYGEYFRNSVFIIEDAIVIPEGKEMYVGYGSPDSGDGSFHLGAVYPGVSSNSYWSPFDTQTSTWSPMYVERAGIYMNLTLELVVNMTIDTDEQDQD